MDFFEDLYNQTIGRFIFGSDRNDTIKGRADLDFIYGFDGNDRIYAGGGDDVVTAGDDNDNIFGGAGEDRIYGDAGNDWITGGTDNDSLFGGSGADKFFFDPSRSGEGIDRIADFDPTLDKIALRTSQVLASDPGIAGLSGDPAKLEVSDFDASDVWHLTGSDNGDVIIVHPNGIIQLDGIAYSDDLTFADLAGALQLIGDPMMPV